MMFNVMETVGRTDITKVTAFTDGCPGLSSVLANAGVTKPPILDWFHIAMRLQHTKLAAASLSTDDPDRMTAKATCNTAHCVFRLFHHRSHLSFHSTNNTETKQI
jgi:hypothetical protein